MHSPSIDGLPVHVKVEADTGLNLADITAALQAGRVGVWKFEPESGMLTGSARCALVFGCDADAPFTYAALLDALHPADVIVWHDAVASALTDSTEVRLECRNTWSDGTLHWAFARATCMVDQASGMVRLAGIFVDITDRKQNELWARQAGADLTQASGRKTDFLAKVGHELRNPLATLRNSLDLLGIYDADTSTRERLRTLIERQVEQMTHVLDDLREVARVERGEFALAYAPCDLHMVLDAAVQLVRPLITAKELQFDQLVAQSVPRPLLIHGDHDRLVHALRNLLHNAAKYTPRGGCIAVQLSLVENQVKIQVRDTGEGIPSQVLPLIFDMFAQTHASLAQSQGGLGVGLALARRVVRLHGGDIVASSEGIDKGAAFTLTVPLTPHGDSPPATAIATAGTANVPAVKVLIVDDDVDSAMSMANLIEMHGHAARVANEGSQALELVEQFGPDVIFLDIGMPGMNGFDVAAALRHPSLATSAIIIALTGRGGHGDVAMTWRDFDHLLTKPADPAAIRDLLVQISLARG